MKLKILIYINRILISYLLVQLLETSAANYNLKCGNRDTNLNFDGSNTSNIEFRVKGGVNTSIPKWPWMAGVYFVNPHDENDLQFSGGASIISKRHLITVAHVLVNEGAFANPLEIAVLVGCELKFGGLRLAVQNIYIHPAYEGPNDFNCDIAIIRVTDDIPISDSTRPISLPKMGDEFMSFRGHVLTSVGWGYTSDLYEDTTILKKVTIPMVSEETCQLHALAKHVFFPVTNFICGGDVAGNRPCKGDSGGPLMITEGAVTTLVGLVDFFLGERTVCGLPGTPFFFLRVAPYLKWIDHVIFSP